MNNLLISSFSLAALSFFNCAHAQTINIDGSFDDWESTLPAITDPVDAPRDSFVDFLRLSAQADGEFVHLVVDFGKPVNIQRLPGSIYIILDVDGDATTGRDLYDLPGADLAVMLTAPYAGGIAVESATWEPQGDDAHKPTGMISPYLVGFTFAPTYQSQIVEMRLRRGAEIPQTPRLFTNSKFGVALVAMDADRNVLDQTKPGFCDLPPLVVDSPGRAASQSSSQSKDANPLARAPQTDFRAVTWNVEYSALLKQPQDFIPILRALDADVILLQELDERTTPDQLAQLLEKELPAPGRSWNVFIGAGGGNLRCAIASRLPMQAVGELELLPFPGAPTRTTRHASVVINIDNRPLLVTSAHLRCCGAADTEEEDARMVETTLLNSTMRSALQPMRARAVLVAGDFNLVGARRPLEQFASNLDVDQSDLAVAEPFQLDGRSNATWSDPDQPYVPGRLDYILFSDSTLRCLRSFVVDSSDLPEKLCRALGIDADMTARASDHLPVVADFQWMDARRSPRP